MRKFNEYTVERNRKIQIRPETRIGYVVQSTAWKHNDEYFSSMDGAYALARNVVYATREAAQELADKLNVDHALEVCGNLRPWCYGAPFGDHLRYFADESLLCELHAKLGGKPKPFMSWTTDNVVADLNEHETLPLDKVDLAWLIKTFALFRAACVEEVEVQEAEVPA